MRPKHWLKNALVAFALIFGRRFAVADILTIVGGIVAFCLISSAVYILNDIFDVENDRKHEVKKNRPVAAGLVSVRFAWFLMALLVILSIALSIFTIIVRSVHFERMYPINLTNAYNAFIASYQARGLLLDYSGVPPEWLTSYRHFTVSMHFGTVILLIVYFVLNWGYSAKYKNIPIVDVLILSSGFLIRIFYGAWMIGQPVSDWLYLTVLALSLYMGLGKRRNELIALDELAGETRKVLSLYTKDFLDKNMLVCLTLTIVFYSFWTLDLENNMLVWSVPLVLTIVMRYSFLTEIKRFADPVDVLLNDKPLIFLTLMYMVFVAVFLIL